MNERAIELVYSELDGVNTPDESAELAIMAEQDASVKAFLEETRELFGALGQMPEHEPPAELKARIMSSIAHQVESVPAENLGLASRLRGLFRPLTARPAWAVAYAFAAGIIVGIAILATLSGPDLTESQTVQGTIGNAVSSVIDQTHLEVGDLTVDLATVGLGSEIVLEVEFSGSPDAPVEILVNGEGIAAATISASGSEHLSIAVKPAEVLVVTIRTGDEEGSASLSALIQ